VDILFLGQNDLCMSMGLYNKYEFPLMYTSPELGAATQETGRAGAQEQRHPRRSSCSALRASARFLGKGIPHSSASATTCHHVLNRPELTSTTWRTSPKEKGKTWEAESDSAVLENFPGTFPNLLRAGSEKIRLCQ